MGTGWYWFFGLLWAYILLIFWLIRSGKMQEWNLSLAFGFVLMIRTQKGKKLLDKMSRPKRFWNLFGDLGIIVALITMIGFTFLLALVVGPSLDPNSGAQAAPANQILVIPGVNPIVPLWYGLIGLIVTLVVHEGGHGLLARANDLKVKSLGLLFAIVPVGAFVEPDEDEIREASLRKRLRVFCAGPMVNITVALLLLIPMVMMISAAPQVAGAGLQSVSVGGPADMAGMVPGDIITQIDDNAVASVQDLGRVSDLYLPGQNATITLASGTTTMLQFDSRWNSWPPEFQQEFQAFGPEIQSLCRSLYGEAGSTDWATCAELAEKDAMLGVGPIDLSQWAGALADPFGESGTNFLRVIYLPLGEVQNTPILSTYLPAFLETPFNADVFWPLYNILFWIFWLNFLVGTFNALPMLPLDGGHIFRDAAAGLIKKVRPGMESERRDRIVGRAAGLISLAIFAIILISLIGPRIAHLWA